MSNNSFKHEWKNNDTWTSSRSVVMVLNTRVVHLQARASIEVSTNLFCFLFQVQEYKNELIKKAEALITQGFPEKICKLNDLLLTPNFADRNFKDVYQVIIVMMLRSEVDL